jgi:ABC-2 type transport system ATP-binding protein
VLARDHHRRGRILADATPDELETRSRYHGAVSLSTTEPAQARELLASVAGVAEVTLDEQDQRLTAFPKKGASIFDPIAQLLREKKVPVSELALERGRLDEVFRSITSAPAQPEARA